MFPISGSIWHISSISPEIFTCKAETLQKIAEGKLDPILAVTLQKLKVEGSIEKALKLKDILAKRGVR